MSDSTCEARIGPALRAFMGLSFAGTLANMRPLLHDVEAGDAATGAWVAATYASHAALYTLVPLLPALLAAACRLRRMALMLAVLLAAAGQYVLFVDVFVFTRFGYHLNGFVWNLITTPGGIDSMGGDATTHNTAIAIGAGLLALSAIAMWMAVRWARIDPETAIRRVPSARATLVVLAALVLVDIGARISYGLASIRGFTPILSAARCFPGYLPLTFRGFAKQMGVEAAGRPDADLRAEAGRFRVDGLAYPKRPLETRADAPRWNVVWLVSESLRADMLDPEVMPRTWGFGARSAARFTRHYSTGNGTRMGVFGMFYGLYGPYWFRFLEAARGPVLIDNLRERGWRMQMQTSAVFSYPEFDRTVFAAIPRERLISREVPSAPGYELDRINVKKLLAFMDEGRAAEGRIAEPFMCFQFFEGPHARYHFPPESVLRPDYLEEMNYATLDLARDMPRVKNRYINAVHELDRQIATVLDGLEERGLMNRTIVVVTGDHGEEFMEKGRWGHNSTFVEEQIRTPLLIHIPGRAPEVVDRMTSHLDIAPTVAAALGVANPPADYCQGADLFGPVRREFCVLAGWDELAYLDGEWKAVFRLGPSGIGGGAHVTRADDSPVADTRPFFEPRRARLVEVLRGLREFGR